MPSRRQWATALRLLASLVLVAGVSGAGPMMPVPRPSEDPPMQLSTYLLFDGRCKEAMTFYQSVLGGELTMTTVGDSPMKAAFPPAMHGRIVSARLKSATVDISASDWLRPGVPHVNGNMVMLYLSGGTPAATRAAFTKLSDGADVTDPLTEQPFGLYGALNDKFGNRWMFHADPEARGGE